jgi:hypothetical protein
MIAAQYQRLRDSHRHLFQGACELEILDKASRQDPIYVPVQVIDIKASYGHVRLNVTPVGGRGDWWVDAERVRNQ